MTSNLTKLNFEKTFGDIAHIVDMPGKKKKNTRKSGSSVPAYIREETKTSTREEEVSSAMDKTNISKNSPEKEQNFESSANNVYNYQKKSFAQVVKGNSCVSKTNRAIQNSRCEAIQSNRSEAMCHDALRTLNKDPKSEKQAKNMKKSDTSSFPHTGVYDEGTMEAYIKVGRCLLLCV